MSFSGGGGSLSIVRDFVTLHDGTVNVMDNTPSIFFSSAISSVLPDSNLRISSSSPSIVIIWLR